MKVMAFIDVETKDQIEKVLEETDLKPFFELGEKLWKLKGGEFEINIPGGKLIYRPDQLNVSVDKE